MPINIPIARTNDDTGFFDLQVVLDGVTYTLEFRWNVRLGAWFLAVLDAEGVVPFLVGLRLVADWPLALGVVDRQPPGRLMIVDTGAPLGQGQDPGFDDLGNRAQMVYFSKSELA